MEGPTIVERDRLLLAGFSFFGDPFRMSEEWTEENQIGRLWQRFMAYGDRLRHLATEEVAYEVHIEHEETPAKGFFEVFVGLAVTEPVDIPLEMVLKALPPSRYAVFTLSGEEIVSDWPRLIYHEWLPESGYEVAYPYMIQYYDSRFKGLDRLAESALDIYIPVRHG